MTRRESPPFRVSIAAIAGTGAVHLHAALAAVQILVLNPLAFAPGNTLGQIHADLAQAGEAIGTPLVLAILGLGPALAVLLMLYMIPMRMFAPSLSHPDLPTRSLAVAGTLLPVAFFDFGLSQTFLAHNSGATFYAFWLAVLWGSYRARRRIVS